MTPKEKNDKKYRVFSNIISEYLEIDCDIEKIKKDFVNESFDIMCKDGTTYYGAIQTHVMYSPFNFQPRHVVYVFGKKIDKPGFLKFFTRKLVKERILLFK